MGTSVSLNIELAGFAAISLFWLIQYKSLICSLSRFFIVYIHQWYSFQLFTCPNWTVFFRIKRMVPQRVCVFQLPVIMDLRNPTLKPRHWAAIEQTVDATLVDPEVPLTLEKLAELHVFDFGQEIQDISGQASGEAALETILKKVNLEKCVFWRSWDIEVFIFSGKIINFVFQHCKFHQLIINYLSAVSSHLLSLLLLSPLYISSFCLAYTPTGTWWQHICMLCVKNHTPRKISYAKIYYLSKYILQKTNYEMLQKHTEISLLRMFNLLTLKIHIYQGTM